MDYNKDIEKLFKESPTFSSSKEVDKLYDMFLRMLQEIAVLKEKGIDSDELINEINKDESHVQELIKHHKEMISRVISNIK